MLRHDNFSCASNTTSSYDMYSIYIYTSLDATSITNLQKESLTRQKDVKQVSEMLERLSKTTS